MLLRRLGSDQPRDQRYLGPLLFDSAREFGWGAAARNLADGRQPFADAILNRCRANIPGDTITALDRHVARTKESCDAFVRESRKTCLACSWDGRHDRGA